MLAKTEYQRSLSVASNQKCSTRGYNKRSQRLQNKRKLTEISFFRLFVIGRKRTRKSPIPYLTSRSTLFWSNCMMVLPR